MLKLKRVFLLLYFLGKLDISLLFGDISTTRLIFFFDFNILILNSIHFNNYIYNLDLYNY